MANALASESSPYLRQHANNPVDWLPWGPKALERARERDVPLLVSIGYSACHWCHVMERESFEDERTARLMNEGFVCVKVDREERPDVDALYMEAVQGMTGHGGWPLNVFLTPEGLPFYGGTYFPPRERPGTPSFAQVLLSVSEAWRERGEEIRASSEQLRERLSGGALLRPTAEPFDETSLDAAVERLRASFDAVHGGFGGAPKFPQASVLEFLMCRRRARDGLVHPAGDGGRGHPRPGWRRVPPLRGGRHLDRAALREDALRQRPARARLPARRSALRRWGAAAGVRGHAGMGVARDEGPEGGFYAALDADSEGVEGRFYVWSVAELESALGEDADAAIRWLGATEEGNFVDGSGGNRLSERGLNVLEDRGPRPDAETRRRIRERLLAARATRTRPGLDDKRLTSWNALMISALAEAGAHLAGMPTSEQVEPAAAGTAGAAPTGTGEPMAWPAGPNETGRRFLAAAAECAEFVLRDLRDPGGRLLRTYNNGEAKIAAYLEDHAFLLEALIALFEATCEERWLAHARALADELIARFSDPIGGGFFSTATDGEALIARRKELEDSPIPAGGSSAAMGLLRLAQLTGEMEYERQSHGAIDLLKTIAPRHPTSFGHMLQAMHWRLSPMRPIACAIPERNSR